ncbi:MAG: DUF6090 family protein [Flavobacteriaceae bacterium]|nr:DUF6090 family protein [Flavobacteriaceae bacterium]
MKGTKASRYIKYAIGEIILVVIGILIALQLNNYNESLKRKDAEIASLKELQSGLRISKQNLETLLSHNERWQGYNLKILDYISNERPYDESLDICFGTYFWTGKANLTTSAYTQLKNDGLDLISNEELRKKIILIFEDRFAQIKNEHEVWDAAFLSETIFPTHVKLFRKYYPEEYMPFSDEYAKPWDYDSLLDNKVFESIIAENISLRRYNMLFKESLITEIDSLDNLIGQEIGRLEN